MRFLEEIIASSESTPPVDSSVISQITDPTKLPYHLLDATSGRRTEKRYKSLRLSEIDGACSREYVLGNLLDLSYFDTARFSNVWQMDMGSAMHWHVQNDPRYFGDRLVGWWECRACGMERRFGVRPQEPCEHCRAHPRVTQYKEYMFRLYNPYRVVGKADAILRIEPRVYRFGEIKTVSKDMENPDGSHIAQIAAYTYFSRNDDKLPITIDRSICYLFYFNKLFNWRSPVKVFPIRMTEALVDPLKKKAAEITNGIATRTLPVPLTPCIASNFSKGRAKNCGIADTCKQMFNTGVNTIEQ
jgi:hypothetical protein